MTDHEKSLKKFLRRWQTFINERFPLLGHVVLIISVFAANAVVAFKSAALPMTVGKNEILGFLALLFLFIHLRIFDEIKDYATDKLIHPERPLVQGLISLREAKAVALFLICIELAIGILIGLPAFLGIICAIFYSFLMYREFFVRKWLKEKLTTYALSHSIISGLFPLFVFSCVTGRYLWKISFIFGLFAFANIILSNIFEFSRKTFAPIEEKDLVDSYSKRFGLLGSTAIIFFLVALSVVIAFIVGFAFHLNPPFYILMGSLFAIFSALSLDLLYSPNVSVAKIYRISGSLYILIFNFIIVIGVLWR